MGAAAPLSNPLDKVRLFHHIPRPMLSVSIAILLAIVFSGILLAATDYISEAARRLSEEK